MNRFRWPLLLFVICLPLVLLAAGFRLPWRSDAPIAAEPLPDGDHELAWFNTTTGGAAWERFVAGVKRVPASLPGVSVDDSRAFPTMPNDVPEVVIAKAGLASKLHIRWYKLSNDHTFHHWLDALSKRNPAPLAIIGGSSSDRAREYAIALQEQTQWHGQRPIFCVTNATAIHVTAPPGSATPTVPLMQIYAGRTFRFCFNNRQMAGALLDFVWQHPDLRPASIDGKTDPQPAIFSLSWKDDPYSEDMIDQFGDALPRLINRRNLAVEPRVFRWQVPFSIGGFHTPNAAEAEAAMSIVKELRGMKQQRSLLVIPTVTAPARRVLMRICEEDASLGRRLVALNGDGMGVNAVLRDAEFNWPVASIPVPLVLFTHNNPAAWDNDTLREPTSTDDVLHTAEMIRILTSAFDLLHANNLPVNADELKTALQGLQPKFFQDDGNRLGSTGEYVFVLRPPAEPVVANITTIEVWKRNPDRTWERVARRELPLKPPGTSP